MKQNFNCKQISARINTIKKKRDEFLVEFNNKSTDCFNTKNELMSLIEKLTGEIWPFEESELSNDKFKDCYKQFKSLFETTGIIKDSQIASDLLFEDEVFKMPSEQEFLEYICDRKEQVLEMAKLGLTEPIIVPIAAYLGKGGNFTINGGTGYDGLLGIVAKEIRELGQTGKLKGTDDLLLPIKQDGDKSSSDQKDPLFLDPEYLHLFYSFKEKDGTFSEGLSRTQFIDKHREAGSPFPGFGIYFKEKGNILPNIRKADDPLFKMQSKRQFADYKTSLRKVGLTGATVHTEIITLLLSLREHHQITRDIDSPKDSASFMGGISFQGNTDEFGFCFWNRHFRKFLYNTADINRSGKYVSCCPIGELI